MHCVRWACILAREAENLSCGEGHMAKRMD